MCRNKAEGKERCNCDTSEARRLRRHNAQALKEFASKTLPVLEKEVIEDIPVDIESLTMDTIRSLTRDIDNIKLLIEKKLSYDLIEEETLVLEDGTEHVVSYRTSADELYSIAEKHTVVLGNTIQQLVEQRTGVTAESIVEGNKKELEKQEKLFQQYQLEKTGLEKERAEKFPAIKDESKNYFISSHGNYSKSLRNKEPEAVDVQARVDKFNARAKKQYAEFLAAENGLDQVTRGQLAINRKEMLSIIGEMRDLGGTIATADNSAKPAVKTLQEVEKFYPSAWIDASNEKEPFRAKVTTSRAHYNDGKWQESFAVGPLIKSTIRPIGWEPDPHDKYESGTWTKMDTRGQWTDPRTGKSHWNDAGSEEQGWVYTQVDFQYLPRGVEVSENPPKGRGWKLYEVKENRRKDYLSESEEVLVKRWGKEVRTRELISSVRQAELTISGKGEAAFRVGMHEFAHRVESTPKIGKYIESVEEAFLVRRTTDTSGLREPLQSLYKGTEEFARPDNFTNNYMGKEYDAGYREVLSTGAEAVFADRFGGLIGLGKQRADNDMKSFIIGLWASA